MGRTTTTATISVPIKVRYVCSKCGTANFQTSMVKESADVSRQGTIHRNSTYEKMSEEANETAKIYIQKRINGIIDEAKTNRFRLKLLYLRGYHRQRYIFRGSLMQILLNLL